MTRRPAAAVLLGSAALARSPRRPGRRAAASTAQAEALVTKLAGELQQLVNSGRSEAQIYAGFEGILARYADMPAVAASVLGPPWRGASAGQKQAFVAAFQHYLARRYGKQFREYRNARIDVDRRARRRQGGGAGADQGGAARPGGHRRRLAGQRPQRQRAGR